MTERLYYPDSYLKEFEAQVIEAAGGGTRVYLDRTAFYPASGGQSSDTGTIGDAAVVEVIDEDGRIAHITSSPVRDGAVRCSIDWPRRFDHMQQHSGQHLLSAVLVELYGIQTIGFHLGSEVSAIDLDTDNLSERQVVDAEEYANRIVAENRPLDVVFEDAATAQGLRKASGREGIIRIVSIEGLDRSACGGTHVRATGEIGAILLRKLERAHGNARIEFLCGMRAVRRARADFDALSKIARTLSSPLDETPALVTSHVEGLAASEKTRWKLAAELAQIRGRELYAATAPNAAGLRAVLERIPKGSLDDELRARAQGFVSGEKASFAAIVGDPPAVLLAVSKDSGIHAGNVVKAAVSASGGRGGGNLQVAQGSVPSKDALPALEAAIRKAAGLDA